MIKFYSNKHIFFGISLVIMLVGIVALFVNGVSLGLEFKGGSMIKYQFKGELDLESIELITTEKMDREATCQILEDNASDETFLVISFAGNEGLSSEEQIKLEEVLLENFADNELSLYETTVVQPFIGRRFLMNGIKAIAIAAVIITLYVWVRFRKIGGLSAGISALVALVHDCLIIFFIYIIFKIPLNENFIAALLTIVGYSVNDTIVIYDRVRENMKLEPKAPLEELVDKSITQSLTRSINTALTTFVSILIVSIFAITKDINSIVTFALPMCFGILSGCYSTICIAGPVWVWWKKYKEGRNSSGTKGIKAKKA